MPSFGRGRGAYVVGSTPQPGIGNLPSATKLATSGNTPTRAAIAFDDGAWAQPWLEQLETYEPGLKKLALQNFAQEAEKSAKFVPEIARALEDEEADVRKVAAYALGKVGPSAGAQAARQLASALKDEDKGVRSEAARALGLLGREASSSHVDKIAVLWKDPHEEPCVAAVEALAALGEARLLGPFVSCDHAQVRRVAIVEVARSPQARIEHASSIAARLTDKETSVRLVAVQASGDIGEAISKDHLASLGAMLTKERQTKIRRTAVQALGKIGDKGIPCLLGFFRDPDEGVRHYAGEVLGGVVGGDKAAEGASAMMEDDDASVRCAALLAMGKLGDSGLVYGELIAEHLLDDNFAARLAAIQALGELGAASQAAALGKMTRDTSKGARQAAVSALAKMGAEGAAVAIRFLHDEDQAVRCAAVRVFNPLHSKLQSHFALPYASNIAALLDDDDWRVRFEVSKALGDLHASEFAPQVGALWKYSDGSVEDNQVKRSAIQAITKMGSETCHYLLPFLDDEDRRVRDEAEREVAAFGGAEKLREQAARLAIHPQEEEEEEEVLSEPD